MINEAKVQMAKLIYMELLSELPSILIRKRLSWLALLTLYGMTNCLVSCGMV